MADERPGNAGPAAPRVSVITPFYNAARFIAESIDSVLAQSFSDWELLLVNDGSTDESAAIVDRYVAARPSRIRCLAFDDRGNRGTSAALNLGIRQARGELIALLDADDVWLPEKLEMQVRLLDAHPEAGMLYSNSLHWHSWSGRPEDRGRDFVPPLGVRVDAVSQPPEILIRCLSRRAAVPCPSSVLMRRDVVLGVGGFEERFRVTFSDQAFYAKMFTTTPVYVANRVWDRYRLHPDSAIAVAKRAGTVRAERGLYLEYSPITSGVAALPPAGCGGKCSGSAGATDIHERTPH